VIDLKKYLPMLMVLLIAMIPVSVSASVDALSAEIWDEERKDVGVYVDVDSAGSPPIIKAKWEIYDENSYKAGTQVYINPNNDPEPKKVWSIIVVTDPNGIEDIANVYLDVYHPDCTFKVQAYAWDITPPNGEGNTPDMNAVIFQGNTLRNLLDKALASGYINQTVYDDIWNEVYKKDARVFIAEFEIHHHQPYGWYIAEAWVTDQGGAISEKFCNYFEVVPVLAYRMDFNSVVFTNIKPGIPKVVYGDEDLSTSDMPTLKNDGNVMIGLAAHDISGVTSTNTNQPKNFRDVFDVRFLDEEIWLNTSVMHRFDGLLPPCHYTQIDFSLHLPLGVPAASYEGTIELMIIGVYTPYTDPDVLAMPCADGWCPGR
jgi:hypothetical protein